MDHETCNFAMHKINQQDEIPYSTHGFQCVIRGSLLMASEA